MADSPLKELEYKTPLEFANTPNMDYVAKKGMNGLIYSVSPEVAPGTAEALLSLFGYDLDKKFEGRGPFEALSCGLDVKPNDLAFRCNFATSNDGSRIVDVRAGRINEGTEELSKAIQDNLHDLDGIKIFFSESMSFRSALVLKGRGLSANVKYPLNFMEEGVDLFAENWFSPSDSSEEAQKTSQILNQFIKKSYEILKDHPINIERIKEQKLPANIIIPWSGGKLPQLEPFSEKWNIKSGCVAAVAVVKGLCKHIGMKIVDVPGATGYIDTNTKAKGDFAVDLFKNSYDLVFLHVEGPDEAGHDGDIAGKIKIIEKIDKMLGDIIRRIPLEKTCIILLSDHHTPIEVRDHTSDPTPITIFSPNIDGDEVTSFSEKAASKGSLSIIKGKELPPFLYQKKILKKNIVEEKN